MSGLLVHEWVAKSGGSERVVDQMVAAFPDADLKVLWNDDPGRFQVEPSETWLAGTPLRRHKAMALPFMPATWNSLASAKTYEWMLVSSHLFAHHARVRGQRELPKLVYAHTPARYVWAPDLDTRGQNPLARVASTLLRPIDRARAQEATAIAANSQFTRDRIQSAWRRDAVVIYPPVDTERISAVEDWAALVGKQGREILDGLPSEFLLGASRFVPYKRLDLVIDAGVAARLPVVLAGDGPAKGLLTARAADAGVPVIFIDRPSDELLYALYQRASAFVFPAVEDFGIMPVEAMAAGTPVIAPSTGGAAESVAATGGGVILHDESAEGWSQAVDQARRIDRTTIAERSHRFSSAQFRHEITSWVNAVV